MSAQSEYEAKVDEQQWAIPAPARPGTLWAPQGGRYTTCRHCGKDYNAHGGLAGYPEQPGEDHAALEARMLARTEGHPHGVKHLTCPAPDLAWAQYRDAQRLLRVDLLAAYMVQQLERLSVEDRTTVLGRVAAKLHAQVYRLDGGQATPLL